MYCRNHKKLLYNKTNIQHYGYLYNKKRVFIDGNPKIKTELPPPEDNDLYLFYRLDYLLFTVY